MRYYTIEHDWVDVQSDVTTIGITDHAQSQLGDVVFVELPVVGAEVRQGEMIAVVESVKAASDIHAPLSGTVIAVNEALVNEPALANTAAEGEGWFFKLRLSKPEEAEALMSAEKYQAFLADQA